LVGVNVGVVVLVGVLVVVGVWVVVCVWVGVRVGVGVGQFPLLVYWPVYNPLDPDNITIPYEQSEQTSTISGVVLDLTKFVVVGVTLKQGIYSNVEYPPPPGPPSNV
jgi:hypothetical protein